MEVQSIVNQKFTCKFSRKDVIYYRTLYPKVKFTGGLSIQFSQDSTYKMAGCGGRGAETGCYRIKNDTIFLQQKRKRSVMADTLKIRKNSILGIHRLDEFTFVSIFVVDTLLEHTLK